MPRFKLRRSLLHRGDVFGNAEGADDASVNGAQRYLAGQHPAAAVRIFPDLPFDLAQQRRAGAKDSLFVSVGKVRIVLGIEIEVGFPDDALGWNTQLLARALAQTKVLREGVFEVDLVG